MKAARTIKPERAELRVYREVQRQIGDLCSNLLSTLDGLGCGRAPDPRRFEQEVHEVLFRLATARRDEPPLSQLQLTGSGQPRKALMVEVLFGLGASDATAARLADTVLRLHATVLGDAEPELAHRLRETVQWELRASTVQLYWTTQNLTRRITAIVEELQLPYGGRSTDPGPGIRQVVGWLQRFPDLADGIYSGAGMVGLRAFPPQLASGADADAQQFAALVAEHLENEALWDTVQIAGLLIAGVTLTLISAGSLGPAAATVMGTGVGLAHGGARVVSATSTLGQGQDAARMGAATPETIRGLERNLAGAWGALAIAVATGGITARFGATASLTTSALRGSVISGTGGALTMAIDPNTWASDDTVGLIVIGTLVGAASGAAGAAMGAAVTRWLSAAPIQIGVSRIDGTVAPGQVVRISTRPDGPPKSARVVKVSPSQDTVTVRFDGSDHTVVVTQVVRLGAPLNTRTDAMFRPARPDDIGPRAVEARVTTDGRTSKTYVRRVEGGIENVGKGSERGLVPLSAIRVYDRQLHARAAGVSVEELDYDPNPGSATWGSHSPVGHGYFARRRHPTAPVSSSPRLVIRGGPHHDRKRILEDAAVPQRLDMRGRGRAPIADEMAVFAAHGSPTGFHGLSTRDAAKMVADILVTESRRGPTPYRYVALASCHQGSRRYILFGRTNAEEFQVRLNERLRQLGIDPDGPAGITVVATDRGGPLRPRGNTIRGEPALFVPAGTQHPLRYAADWPRNLRATARIVGVFVGDNAPLLGSSAIFGTGTARVLHDAESVQAWVSRNASVIRAAVFGTPRDGP